MTRVVIGTDAINAAATAIASAETRAPIQKKRWGSWLSLYICFGSNKNKRIGHAVLIPEGSEPPTSQLQSTAAPPSSPASFLTSTAQSPTGLISNMYSPTSIFSIGPYTYETQLVSPPVFSTEPSTAPYTPPHFTTPSSPEVPFARLLDPLTQYEFQSYQLQPGQPFDFA